MEKNFKSILSLICEVRLGVNRINDVKLDNETYRIDFVEYVKSDDTIDYKPCLRNSKNKPYEMSERQLAALRMATGDLTSGFLDEFRNDDKAQTLQDVARELQSANKAIDDLRIKVVAQLKVRNHSVSTQDTPTYEDFCYEGHKEYKKKLNDLLEGKDADFFKTPEYWRPLSLLREELHSTALRTGYAKPSNIVLLPVFKVV